MELKDKLQKEIGKRMEELNKLDATSDEYRKMVENSTKLMEKYNDLMKTEYESSNCFDLSDHSSKSLELKVMLSP